MILLASARRSGGWQTSLTAVVSATSSWSLPSLALVGCKVQPVRRISRSGVSFGGRHQSDIGLGVQHVSNGGIKNPNDGLTHGALMIRYRLPQR
jgi:hypothetical protein